MKKVLYLILGLSFVFAPLNTSFASGISSRLKGRILLQVESNGEAWYVNPDNEKRYYLGRPADAFQVMRELGLGISNNDFNSFNGYAPTRLSGKILLKVEDSGKAYYVNPIDLKLHYLGRPEDAFQIMRELGLGISNDNLEDIVISESAMPIPINQKLENNIVEVNTEAEDSIVQNNSDIKAESDIYKSGIRKIIDTYVKSYDNLNSDANSIISIINERISVLRVKGGELSNLSYGQDEIVADMIKNLSSIYISDIKPLEDKIEAINKVIEINYTRIATLNEITNRIKREDFIINEELFNKLTEAVYSHDEWLQLADQTLEQSLNNYKLAMQTRDAEYKIGWNQILTISDIVYYNPPQYTAPNYSSSYRPMKVKCYFNRNYNGTVSSVNCY